MLNRYRGSYLSYFLMYTFYFLSWSLFSTLISVYLLNLGYQASQVSFVVSLSFFASMMTQPVIGLLNDKYSIKLVTTVLFSLTILGSVLFMMAQNIWLIALSYSLVLLLFNGTNPVLERIATTSHFTYGKIRIWGTIGFAIGSQSAGLIYDYIAPQAIFIIFIFTMALAIIGLLGTGKPGEKRSYSSKKEQVQDRAVEESFFKNKTFLLYIIMAALLAAIMNIAHTYIPAMLEYNGLSVGTASTVVAISVLFEAPLTFYSYLFMDKFKSKQLLLIPLALIMVQYTVYALHFSAAWEVIVTLLAKHTSGILYIMINTKVVASLVAKHRLITALALVQTARSFASIILQNLVGQILDVSSYTVMCWFLLGLSMIVLLFVNFLKIPDGTNQKLFS